MKSLALILALYSASLATAQSRNGYTTRFWDCCKGTCSWGALVPITKPVASCDKNDKSLGSPHVGDGCSGDLAYGFAAANVADTDASDSCCSCYSLTFSDGPTKGKRMIVQAISSAYNAGDSQFDLLIPGSGVGETNGCASQWGNVADWGAQFGGVFERASCNSLPEKLRPGCYWRFDWCKGADNPAVTYERVSCPKELTDISGCRRGDDGARPSTTTSRVPASTGLPYQAQCGGRSYSGPTTCASGLECVFVTDNLYQCLRPGQQGNPTITITTTRQSTITNAPRSTTSASTTRTVIGPSTIAVPPGYAGPWEQCGGSGNEYHGPTRCVSGFVCTEVSKWYHQCKRDQ